MHFQATTASHKESSQRVDASELLRNAYNAAFDELELGWHWGVSQFRELQHHTDERSRMHAYLSAHQPHMLKVYNADFFVHAVREANIHYYQERKVTGNLVKQLVSA